MKEPINEVDKNAVSLVRTNLIVKEKWLSMYNRNLHDCIHFLSLLHYALDIFATRKYVNHRDEYGLVIPTNLQSLHFHGPEKAIKLAKK